MFKRLVSWTCIVMVLGPIAASTASAETTLNAYESCRTLMSKPNENDSANRLVVRTEQGDPTRSYKCWVKFDVSGIDVRSLTSATFVTTLWKDRGKCELDVSYVNDDVVENINWTTKDLTWDNAPGNDPASEGLLDLTQTTLLGRPQQVRGLAGDQFTVDALAALQADTDGIVQFVLHNASAYLQIAHHQDPQEEWRPFLIVTEGPTDKARKPRPADGAEDVYRSPILSWVPGGSADKHDVYLGTVFDDVNNASAGSPLLVGPAQDANTCEPGSLEFGTTYYWRVDEINAPPDSTVITGDVWSFTTEPHAYPLANVIATASSSEKAESGPQNTVNGSGLTDDLHSTATTAMWLSSAAGPEPAWIQYEFDRVCKLHELWVWNHNVELEPIVGYGFKDVAIECSLDGTTWTLLKETEFTQAAGGSGYAHNTTVALDGVMAQYVRLTAKSNWSTVGLKQRGLSEVRFFHVPLAAREPQPADGASDVAPDIVLNWRPGREATSHKVCLGTDQTAVTEGTVAGVTVTEPRYAPTPLMLDTTYFWKVDEVGTAGVHPGDVWSFSTSPYSLIDDFESYNDQENQGTRIYEVWVDGYGTTTNGSQVGNLEAPFAEKTIIHGSRQSMPLFYDNSGGKTSEATRTFEAAQDWTVSGIKSLSLWFHGAADNTGQLYIKINNTKVLYNGGAAELKVPQWQQWNIDLTTVSGANKVTKLTIGIEGAGATGVVYIDDIRLYPKTPEMLIPAEPVKTGLLAEYLFENGANDTSGNSHHGTFLGDARVANSRLVLDGTDDAVFIPRLGGAAATHAQCTYSMWIYSLTKPEVSGIIGGINYDNWAEGGGIHCKLYNGRANVGISGVPGGDLNGTTIVNAEEWIHLGLTVTDTTVTLYLNGQVEASRTYTTPLQMILGRGCIGAYRNNNDIQRELKGQMDDVRIYNRAVSLEEMLWLAGRRDPAHKPF